MCSLTHIDSSKFWEELRFQKPKIWRLKVLLSKRKFWFATKCWQFWLPLMKFSDKSNKFNNKLLNERELMSLQRRRESWSQCIRLLKLGKSLNQSQRNFEGLELSLNTSRRFWRVRLLEWGSMKFLVNQSKMQWKNENQISLRSKSMIHLVSSWPNQMKKCQKQNKSRLFKNFSKTSALVLNKDSIIYTSRL